MGSLSTLLEAVHGALEKAWKRYPQLDQGDFSSDDLRVIGADAADIAIGNLFWLMALGEYVRAPELAEGTSYDVNDIAAFVREGRLVGLIGRRQTFLPVWQFSDIRDLKLHPDAVAILEAFLVELGDLFRPEQVISWASTRQPELHDQEPRDLVGRVGLTETLRESAHVAAVGLAR